jgi:hypothetical protein
MDPLPHPIILVCFLERDQETLQDEHFFHIKLWHRASPFNHPPPQTLASNPSLGQIDEYLH